MRGLGLTIQLRRATLPPGAKLNHPFFTWIHSQVVYFRFLFLGTFYSVFFYFRIFRKALVTNPIGPRGSASSMLYCMRFDLPPPPFRGPVGTFLAVASYQSTGFCRAFVQEKNLMGAFYSKRVFKTDKLFLGGLSLGTFLRAQGWPCIRAVALLRVLAV